MPPCGSVVIHDFNYGDIHHVLPIQSTVGLLRNQSVGWLEDEPFRVNEVNCQLPVSILAQLVTVSFLQASHVMQGFGRRQLGKPLLQPLGISRSESAAHVLC